MTEEKAQDVNNQEVVAPEANLEAKNSTHDDKANDANNEPVEGSKEYNWRQMQKSNEELREKINELARLEEERNRPKPPQEEDELLSLSDDDIITASQARKLAEEIIKKTLEQRERASLPDRTRKQFNDYDSIMTQENIKKLEMNEPGLAEACSIASNPWEATYKILKKFVLPAEEKKVVKSEKQLNDNLAAPMSSNAVNTRTPLSDANSWGERSKEEIYNEMVRLARGG